MRRDDASSFEQMPWAGAPTGTSTANVRIAPSRNVVIACRLSEGTAFTSAAFRHADQSFPLHAILSSGDVTARGSLRGLVRFASPARSIRFKLVRPLDAAFPLAFDVNAYVQFQMNAK